MKQQAEKDRITEERFRRDKLDRFNREVRSSICFTVTGCCWGMLVCVQL